MTSQDSWIDQDEINQLVNSIEGKKETSAPTPQDDSPSPEEKSAAEDDVSLSPDDMHSEETELGEEETPFALDKQPDNDAAVEEETPISSDEPPESKSPSEEEKTSDGTSDCADENETGGYIFSLGDDEEIDNKPEGEEPTSQESMRQPQVVQALAEVRNRANRGGLLKSSFQKGPSPLWPEFPPLDDEKPRPEPEVEAIVDKSDSNSEHEPIAETPTERPNPLRKRLEEFADSTVTKFDATGFSITDFAGYQLLQRGDEDTLALSAAASLVTDQINQLSEAVGAPELGSTQISLSDDRWLCLVEAQSSAGGILAQLQLPEPMTSSATSSFRRDLEAVLAS